MQVAQFKPNSVLESLTYVPGLVGEITDWIIANAHYPCREYALGAAVTVVGALVSRHAVGPKFYLVSYFGLAHGLDRHRPRHRSRHRSSINVVVMNIWIICE
jgi:hypothetical protein